MKKNEALPEVVRESFLIDLKGTKNHSWQGNITWVAKEETVAFRSALELLHLISTAVDEEGDPIAWGDAPEQEDK